MAQIDYSKKYTNNQKRIKSSTVAALSYKNGGTAITNTDTYLIGVIPAKSIVTAIYLVSDTPFDSATSAAVNIGDGTTAAKWVSAADLKSAKNTVISGVSASVGKYYETAQNIIATHTLTGATTVGSYRVIIEYIETETKDGAYIS